LQVFFSKSNRHQTLIDVTNGAAIFVPGSIGTRQEIFTYASKIHEGISTPMIFLDKQFWEGNGIFPVIKNLEGNHLPLLLCTDDTEEIFHKLILFMKFKVAN